MWSTPGNTELAALGPGSPVLYGISGNENDITATGVEREVDNGTTGSRCIV